MPKPTRHDIGIFTSILGLLWLLPFYNVGGLRNGWFTIFVNLDQSFAAGLSQVRLRVVERCSLHSVGLRCGSLPPIGEQCY